MLQVILRKRYGNCWNTIYIRPTVYQVIPPMVGHTPRHLLKHQKLLCKTTNQHEIEGDSMKQSHGCTYPFADWQMQSSVFVQSSSALPPVMVLADGILHTNRHKYRYMFFRQLLWLYHGLMDICYGFTMHKLCYLNMAFTKHHSKYQSSMVLASYTFHTPCG